MIDEELTLKQIGCLQQSDKKLLKMTIHGQDVRLHAVGGRVVQIPLLMFYRMSVKEILQTIGIKADEKARNI